MGVTESVAQFIADSAGMALPGEVVRRTKLALLDCLGVAVAGARFPSSRIMLDYIQESGGTPQARVVGTRFAPRRRMRPWRTACCARRCSTRITPSLSEIIAARNIRGLEENCDAGTETAATGVHKSPTDSFVGM